MIVLARFDFFFFPFSNSFHNDEELAHLVAEGRTQFLLFQSTN